MARTSENRKVKITYISIVDNEEEDKHRFLFNLFHAPLYIFISFLFFETLIFQLFFVLVWSMIG